MVGSPRTRRGDCSRVAHPSLSEARAAQWRREWRGLLQTRDVRDVTAAERAGESRPGEEVENPDAVGMPCGLLLGGRAPLRSRARAGPAIAPQPSGESCSCRSGKHLSCVGLSTQLFAPSTMTEAL